MRLHFCVEWLRSIGQPYVIVVALPCEWVVVVYGRKPMFLLYVGLGSAITQVFRRASGYVGMAWAVASVLSGGLTRGSGVTIGAGQGTWCCGAEWRSRFDLL